MTAHAELHEVPEPAEAGSLLDRLRAERAKSVAGEHVHIRIPGYKDVELLARYRFVDADESKRIGARIRAQFNDDADRLLYVAIDLLAAACDGIYVREPGERELKLLEDPGVDSGPLTYEPRLAEILGIQNCSSARDIIRALFRDNDYAIAEHGQRLQMWLADTTANVDEASLGEA